MKHIRCIVAVLSLCLLVSCTSAGNNTLGTNGEPAVPSRTFSTDGVNKTAPFTFENKEIIFKINPEDASFTVTQKHNNQVWYSNPPADKLDGLNSAQVKNLSSQINLQFTDTKNNNLTLDSYADSVLKKQFSVSEIENGVRVDYIIGSSDAMRLLPDVMEKSEFEEYVNKMTAEEREETLKYYSFYEYDEEKAETTLRNVISRFPIIKTMDLYVLNTGTQRIIEKLTGYFVNAGLTSEGLRKAYEKVEYTDTREPQPSFRISLLYTLSSDSLSVTVPAASIDYDQASFYLKDFSLLKYFAAQTSDTDGYIFVPDGSGALMDFTNDNNIFYQSCYGEDYAFSTKTFSGYTQPVILPVFGIKSGKGAIIGIAEQGSAMSSIVAGNDGNTSYNFALFNFRVTENEYLDLGGRRYNGGMTVFCGTRPESDYKVRYYFLNDDNSDYTGMAKRYQEYLFADSEAIDSEKQMPLFLRSMGAIDVQSEFFGVSVTKKRALTKYSEAEAMIKQLNNAGFDSVYFRYSGWANGGMKSTAPSRVDLMSLLGGEKEFKNLLLLEQNTNNKIFLDVDFAYVQKEGKGFSPTRDASRYLNGNLAQKYDFNAATLQADSSTAKYVISPERYLAFAQSFISNSESLNISGLFLSGVGENLNSNFYRGHNEITRDRSENYVAELLNVLSENKYELSVSSGNAYTLRNIGSVTDLPLTASSYDYERTSVPFLQTVLRGYVEYAGSPVNLSGEERAVLLRSVECGAGLQFLMNAAPVTATKNTEYSYLFASQFEEEKSDLISLAGELQTVLKVVGNSKIKNHEIREDGLRITTFENGAVCAVNYGSQPLVYSGNTVDAQDYICVKP